VSLRKGITRFDETPKKAGKPGLWELKAVPNLSKTVCIKFLRFEKNLPKADARVFGVLLKNKPLLRAGLRLEICVGKT